MHKIIRAALAGTYVVFGSGMFVFTQLHLATPAAAQATASRLESVQADLGLRLLVALAGETKTGSSVQASPASLTAVFSYLHLGADPIMKGAIAKMLGFKPEEGEAAITGFRQSAKTLIGASPEKGPLAFAYGMFVKSPGMLKPGASDLLASEGMGTSVADISTDEGVAIVNKWVADHTADLIPKLLPGRFPDAILTAVNALYFKDKWVVPFDPKKTKRAPFHLVDGKTADVDMMSLHKKFAVRENDRFVAVKLPYKTPGFSLVVVTTRDEPTPMVEFAGIADWLVGTDFQEQDVNLSFPRFNIDTNFNLFPILAKAGLGEGFQSPDPFPLLFSGRISAVIQGCVIKVDEEGTEAAAATAVVVTKSMSYAVEARFDKPFVYALRDERQGMILLTGYVANPGAP